jgi:hypothetical protein
MNSGFRVRRLAAALSASVLLLASGCEKKRPHLPPAAAEAPALNIPSPFPASAPVAETSPPAPPVVAEPQPEQPEESPAAATKSKNKHTNHSKNSGKEVATKTPGKVVVENGGAPEPPAQAISAGIDQTQAAHQRQVTEQLLQSTDSNLKGLNRTLSSEELAMVEQIKAYVSQSRAAITDGDLVKANNLAVKAHLLSDALVKR